MCLKQFLATLKPKPIPVPLELTHPEELPNTEPYPFLDSVFSCWLVQWQVPEAHYGYWRNEIIITINPSASYAAGTWTDSDGKRHLDVRPEWLVPGVIAHEQAHNSYALLTDAAKFNFAAEYLPLVTTDPLIKLLYSLNTYGLTSVIEGHAEVYRYIADKMPSQLKKYYPRLF